MPQFILDHGSDRAAARYNALDAFTRGYIEAMFFTATDEAEDGTVAELSCEAWERILHDTRDFKVCAAELLAKAWGDPNYGPTRSGHDLWYTRNGHGTGFWDRGLGRVGDLLTETARNRGIDLYRGDDGLLYLA